MEKPVLSLIGPSIRTHLWPMFYEVVKQSTTLPFEIIFAGPSKITDSGMPDNFIYIQTSNIKPVQCWQIAATKARGEVIALVGDDLIFSPKCFDEAYSIYCQKQNYKAIIALRMLFRGVDQTWTCVFPRYNPGPDKNPLLVPALAIVSKKFFSEMGGYDRSFLFADANFDFFLRAYHESGAEFFWTKDGESDEDVGWAVGTHGINNYDGGVLEYSDINRLEQLWYPNNGPLLKERTAPLDPFIMDDTIYTISQGANHSKWI